MLTNHAFNANTGRAEFARMRFRHGLNRVIAINGRFLDGLKFAFLREARCLRMPEIPRRRPDFNERARELLFDKMRPSPNGTIFAHIFGSARAAVSVYAQEELSFKQRLFYLTFQVAVKFHCEEVG